MPLVRKTLYSLLSSAALAMMLFSGSAATSLDTARAVPCDNPLALAAGGSLQAGTAGSSQAASWISFQVQKGQHYVLSVSPAAGLDLAVFGRCDAGGTSAPLTSGRLEFTALQDGTYYLLARQSGATTANASSYDVSLSPAAAPQPNEVAIQGVPTAVLRRATEFLEQLRGSGLAPEWADARISSKVNLLYRPDMRLPAFYEFGVEKPGAVGAPYIPAGYLQLAAGDFDYPLVNWNMTGKTATQELADMVPQGGILGQVFRLNAASYVGEYSVFIPIGLAVQADQIVRIGDLPTQTQGLEKIPDQAYPLVTETTDSTGQTSYEGPAPLALVETPWASWAALKTGYATAYDQQNRSLKQRASAKWTLEKNLLQYGETLKKGDVRTVFGLAADTLASLQVTGEGAKPQYLQQDLMKPAAGSALTGVTLTVLDEPADPKTLLPFQVDLTYTSGVTETLKFNIANHTALTYTGGQSIYLPIVAQTSSQRPAGDQPQAKPAAVTAPTWGPWHYYWVDGAAHGLDITYNQIPAHTDVNTSDCYSGCAATGWAMNFAWVDQRAAEGHPIWGAHWGIYRTNGSVGGANAVAPLGQNVFAANGVNNIEWELRGELHTSCSGSSGGTALSDEIRAADYVRPRATAGWRMSTRYDSTRLCWFGACDPARSLIATQIIYHRAPAVLGAYYHIQLAVGYAYQTQTSCFLWICSTDYNRWFYVNKGWGGSGNTWVDWDDVYMGGIYTPWSW